MTRPNQSPIEILKTVYGYQEFRGQQAEIIDHVLAGNNAFVLMPTGGGGSRCVIRFRLCAGTVWV